MTNGQLTEQGAAWSPGRGPKMLGYDNFVAPRGAERGSWPAVSGPPSPPSRFPKALSVSSVTVRRPCAAFSLSVSLSRGSWQRSHPTGTSQARESRSTRVLQHGGGEKKASGQGKISWACVTRLLIKNKPVIYKRTDWFWRGSTINGLVIPYLRFSEVSYIKGFIDVSLLKEEKGLQFWIEYTHNALSCFLQQRKHKLLCLYLTKKVER